METWKTISDHPNYSVSDLGRIRNNKTGKILKPFSNPDGYSLIDLNSKTRKIHQLVGLYFVENPNGYPEVNHIFGNKKDNRACVLEWVTRGMNQSHAYKTGLRCGKGGLNPAAKLTEEKVLEIRLKLSNGDKQGKLSREYGVHQSKISAIKTRKTWSHI